MTFPCAEHSDEDEMYLWYVCGSHIYGSHKASKIENLIPTKSVQILEERNIRKYSFLRPEDTLFNHSWYFRDPYGMAHFSRKNVHIWRRN